MNRGLYTTATGMITCQQAIDVVANNLANSSTNAYKQDGLVFGEMLSREMYAEGGTGQSLGSIGSGGEVKTAFTDFSQGTTTQTNNPLDMALQGPGMFAIETKSGIRYTRDGSFSLRPDGTLITKLGDIVLDGQQRPIVLPQGQIQIAGNGRIRVGGEEAAQIGVFSGKFTKTGYNLFNPVGEVTPMPMDAEGAPQVRQGNLENSNVQPILEMVNMIKLTRIFELSQKSAQAQDDATGKLIGTMQ